MAYGSWQEIIAAFKTMVESGETDADRRCTISAQGVLRIIPKIRSLEGIENLIPMTSLCTLVLTTSRQKSRFDVSCDEYSYLIASNINNASIQETMRNVDEDHLLTELKNYIRAVT